jgi:hypothetical protein
MLVTITVETLNCEGTGNRPSEPVLVAVGVLSKPCPPSPLFGSLPPCAEAILLGSGVEKDKLREKMNYISFSFFLPWQKPASCGTRGGLLLVGNHFEKDAVAGVEHIRFYLMQCGTKREDSSRLQREQIQFLANACISTRSGSHTHVQKKEDKKEGDLRRDRSDDC